MGRPRVHPKPTLPPYTRDVVLVEYLECQPEPCLKLLFPLEQHGRWATDHDLFNLLAQQELARNQPGFDRLAQSDIIRDEKIDAWQPQSLSQRLKLICVEADSGP